LKRFLFLIILAQKVNKIMLKCMAVKFDLIQKKNLAMSSLVNFISMKSFEKGPRQPIKTEINQQ
jgi:hypothetical protein